MKAIVRDCISILSYEAGTAIPHSVVLHRHCIFFFFLQMEDLWQFCFSDDG